MSRCSNRRMQLPLCLQIRAESHVFVGYVIHAYYGSLQDCHVTPHISSRIGCAGRISAGSLPSGLRPGLVT